MRQKTQIDTVKRILSETGHISRNQCLSMFISRLSAYALDLRNEGWKIEGKKSGNDYVYTLKSKPHIPQVKIIERLDEFGNIKRIAQYV